MNKLSFEDWKNSMSFMIDDEFDQTFLKSTEEFAKFLNSSCDKFSDKDQLKKFLTQDDENYSSLIKLKALVSLIGFSEERLKRAVTLARREFFGEKFKSEWSINKISKMIISNDELCHLLVDFFINSRNSKIGKEIPLYYLRNFKLLDEQFMVDLKDFNYVNRILNDNEIQGKYSNQVGDYVERVIQKRLIQYKNKINSKLTYDIQKEFPLLNKNIDILIPSVDSAIILIESSYNITTGSGQSSRADKLVDYYSHLMKHNANHRKNKIIMMNYCDGFGWVGRQNDLHRIYDASDFVFNQKNLNVLDEVLDVYYPK